jgi:hypothetical protein
MRTVKAKTKTGDFTIRKKPDRSLLVLRRYQFYVVAPHLGFLQKKPGLLVPEIIEQVPEDTAGHMA